MHAYLGTLRLSQLTTHLPFHLTTPPYITHLLGQSSHLTLLHSTTTVHLACPSTYLST